VQIVVATITQDGDDYALKVIAAARARGLRVEGDLRNEKISYKVREHSLAKVPVLLVVGKRESVDRSVSVRRLGSQDQGIAPLEEALAALAAESEAPDLKRLRGEFPEKANHDRAGVIL
jgi:threonyl-tRNA synthetase